MKVTGKGRDFALNAEVRKTKVFRRILLVLRQTETFLTFNKHMNNKHHMCD